VASSMVPVLRSLVVVGMREHGRGFVDRSRWEQEP
jgi:hypothetical protein